MAAHTTSQLGRSTPCRRKPGHMLGRSATRRLLLWLLLVVGLCGCGRFEAIAMIEERPTDVEDAPGCRSDDDAARGWQYRSQLDMGEVPPSHAKRGKKSYIGRTAVTKEVESSFSLKSGLLIGEVVLLLVSVFLWMVAIGALWSKSTTKKRKLALFGSALLTGGAAAVLGYAAGSVVSLDNPTKKDVSITIDGHTVELPAGRFTDVRVAATTVTIETAAGGKPVEELSMSLDDGIFETFFRSTLGDGRYIYSVCGTTKYHLSSAKYE